MHCEQNIKIDFDHLYFNAQHITCVQQNSLVLTAASPYDNWNKDGAPTLCRFITWEGSLLSNFSNLMMEMESLSDTPVHLNHVTLIKRERILLNSVALQDLQGV